MNARALASPAAAGFVMGAALPIARVTRPEVIIAWLDVTGDWDPALFFFFLPAAALFHVALRWARARELAGLGPALQVPPNRDVDLRLVAGACLFGAGWAIAGSCPGPALAVLGTGEPWAALFVLAMIAGLYLGDLAPGGLRTAAPSTP